MTPPDILFATMAVGGSHVANAQAMAEAVESVAPGRYSMDQRELALDYEFNTFDNLHKGGWRKALEHPWTVVWGQRLIDALPVPCQFVERQLFRPVARKAAVELSKAPPKLVVVNHPIMCLATTMAQRQYGLRVPVLTYQSTTLDATALWAVRDVQRMMFGSPIARDILARMGVPLDRMDVVGYPVRKGFLTEETKSDAREAIGLDPDKFCALVSLGGEGVGQSTIEIIRTLRTLNDPIQQVVVTGRNPHLRDQVLAETDNDPLIRVEGFVDNMWEFLSAADLFVGKTGPATTLEVLSRGCPLIATSRSGPNENHIAKWLESKGLGRCAFTPAELRNVVEEYRSNPALLNSVASAAAKWDFPDMFERVGRYIAHFAETGEADTTLCGPGVF